MTNPRELQRALARWQGILCLGHWTISAKYVEQSVLDADSTANSNIDQYHQRAVISILHPRFHDKEAPEYESANVLLVHELLHCRLFPDGIREGTPEHLALEQGLNILARLLVDGEH